MDVIRIIGKFYSFFIILAIFPTLIYGSNDYRQEIPVKMLDVRSFATRYPASNSEFRTSLENGYVIWIHLSFKETYKSYT